MRVLLCPITHTPPRENVGRYLGLDHERSWIKIAELNRIVWPDPGIMPATASRWAYGRLPYKLWKRMRDGVYALSCERKLTIVARDD